MSADSASAHATEARAWILRTVPSNYREDAGQAIADLMDELLQLRRRLQSVMHMEDWEVESDEDLIAAADSCYRKALLYGPSYEETDNNVELDDGAR